MSLLLAQTPVETAQKKMRATEAYKAKKYDVACPLFLEVVTEQKYDAWGWNDLAVCRFHVGELGGALDAMENASALEKALGGDEPLANAIKANEVLLIAALKKRTPVDGATAARLAARRETTDSKTACELFDLALKAAVTLEQKDWAFIAGCRSERNDPAELVVEALRHTDDVFAPAYELGGRERSRRASGISADWKTSCTPLTGPCGAKLLACSNQSESNENYTESFSESLVFIEAASLKRWQKSPFDTATDKQVTSSEFSSSPVRCPAGEGMTALDSVESGHVLLSVDACARNATFLVFDRQCSNGTAQLAVEPIVVLSSPR